MDATLNYFLSLSTTETGKKVRSYRMKSVQNMASTHVNHSLDSVLHAYLWLIP